MAHSLSSTSQNSSTAVTPDKSSSTWVPPQLMTVLPSVSVLTSHPDTHKPNVTHLNPHVQFTTDTLDTLKPIQRIPSVTPDILFQPVLPCTTLSSRDPIRIVPSTVLPSLSTLETIPSVGDSRLLSRTDTSLTLTSLSYNDTSLPSSSSHASSIPSKCTADDDESLCDESVPRKKLKSSSELRERNRIAASRSRQRKTDRLQQLQHQSDTIKLENDVLRTNITSLEAETRDIKLRVDQMQSFVKEMETQLTKNNCWIALQVRQKNQF